MFQKTNSFLAGVMQNLDFRCKGPKREAVREQCLCNDLNVWSRAPLLPPPPPPPPLWDDPFMSLSFRGRKLANPKNLQAINLFQLFCSLPLPPPPPPLNAHCYCKKISPHELLITFSKTRRGCRHTHLVSTMGVIQCDLSPLTILATTLKINVFIWYTR